MKGDSSELFTWDTPVRVRIGHGMIETVWGPLDALTYLSVRWPAERGKFHEAAQERCESALQGLIKLDEAREAFIAAAIEARIVA